MLSALNSSDPYEQLIAQIIRIESQPQMSLKQQRSKQESAKSVLSDVNSKISALHTLVKEFTTDADLFTAKTVGGKAYEGFKVSAGDDAALGSHTLSVTRMARADTRFSYRYSAADGDLRSFFDTHGTQTFNIEVASPTDEDPDNRVSIEVTVDPAGTTNDDILGEISDAINTAMSDAAEAGTLTTAQKASAQVMHESSDTARLSLRSPDTGFSNRLTFSDSANGLLAALELTNTSKIDGGINGGVQYTVGSNDADSELNAVFELDGLTHYRSSNSVTDAIEGVTLDLLKAGGEEEEFSIVTDKDSIKSKVDDFIKKYNALISHIKQKSAIDPEAGTRGALAGDSTFTQLRFSVRDDVSRAVSGQPSGAPSYLSDLGITIEEDGTLKLSSSDTLLTAVANDATAVQSFFSGEDGIATRLFDRLDGFMGSKGIIKQREEIHDAQIKRLDERIKDWDGRLAQRTDALRRQYAKFQETIALLQGQSNTINAFLYGF